MNWTSEKPTVAGWYWMRAPKCGWRDCVVWVDKDEDGFYIDVGDCDSEYVMDIEAEWLGPITPDSFQQGRVAGLLQAGEAYIKYLMNPEYRKSWKTFDEWCRWMAQQAQDEKGVGDANIKIS